MTDSLGQVVVNTIDIAQPDAINANLNSTDIDCNGNSTGQILSVTTGGIGSYTYQWNTGQTTSSINSLAAGTYTVTITDSLGCVVSESITLTDPVALTANQATIIDVSCNGTATGQATITGNGRAQRCSEIRRRFGPSSTRRAAFETRIGDQIRIAHGCRL